MEVETPYTPETTDTHPEATITMTTTTTTYESHDDAEPNVAIDVQTSSWKVDNVVAETVESFVDPVTHAKVQNGGHGEDPDEVCIFLFCPSLCHTIK